MKIARLAHVFGILVGATLLATVAGCTPTHHQSTFGTVGPVAESQLTLFYWIFWAALIVFIAVEGALIYTVVRYRRKPGDKDPDQTHGHTSLEIGWTILPTLILAIVAIPTVFTIFDNARSPDPEALTVNVIAHQWWWEFHYPDPKNPENKIVTANEIHIPTNEVINITLDSKDVLHSFWIPKIAGKVDIVPNNTNTMWIRANESGEFFGQCAEFCGEAHALMKFKVIAQPRLEFDTWLVNQRQIAQTPVDPLALEGQALFEGSAQCWSCHKVEGSKKARGTTGPNLTHIASRRHIAAGILTNNQENLRSWLRNPNDIKPGNIMFRNAAVYKDPTRALTDVQIAALVAYLQNLK